MKSLSVTSIDLGRCLAERSCASFRATGTCMYPNIRPGDVLKIIPCSFSDVKIGDIAVCRANGLLFAHRVILKGERDGKSFIVTSSDRSRTGNDPPVYDEDFLGIVSSISRNGKSLNIDQLSSSVSFRLYDGLVVALVKAKKDLKKILTFGAGLSFESKLGRILTQFWMRRYYPHIGFSVRIPLNKSLGDSVYQVVDPDLFRPDGRFNGKQINRWILALHFNNDCNPDPAAWIVFTRNLSVPSPWHVEKSHIRTRYRGADLHEKLKARAKKIIGPTFS